MIQHRLRCLVLSSSSIISTAPFVTKLNHNSNHHPIGQSNNKQQPLNSYHTSSSSCTLPFQNKPIFIELFETQRKLEFRTSTITTLTPPLPTNTFRMTSTSVSSTPTTTNTMMTNDPSIMFQRKKDRNITKSNQIICTHSGTFQADEAMGCWLLRQLPEYYQSNIVRTRDDSIISSTSDTTTNHPKVDIVLDVGGVYNHAQKRYDHHQRDYSEYFDYDEGKATSSSSSRCTKLSASGLIYRHYGKEVIMQHYPNLSNEYLDIVYRKLYDTLLEALDAIDTGVEIIPPDCGITLLYKDNTGLSSRVSRLNPRWNEVMDDITGLPPNPDERFERAMQLCGDDFMSCLINLVESDLPARMYVDRAIQNRYTTDPSGRIITLESGGLPWLNHLYELERIYHIEGHILYVLYTDQQGMWRIQAVTKQGTKFTNRLDLPDMWKGLRDEELCTKAGIRGCRFVHSSGFIGGNDTYEGILQMAQAALSNHDKE
jgi:uncharacterized UPF0160 family protein